MSGISLVHLDFETGEVDDKNRYGFIGVDLSNKYNRYRKKSSDWIQNLAEDNIIK